MANSSTRAGTSTRSGDEAHAAEPAGHLAQRGQVHVNDRLDARPLHLDHHVRRSPVSAALAGSSRARCAWPRDAAATGISSTRGEHPLQRPAQLGLGESPDGGERHGRHLVLQPLQLGRDLRREHVQPGGHELANLDHQAAKIHGEHVEALGEAPHPL